MLLLAAHRGVGSILPGRADESGPTARSALGLLQPFLRSPTSSVLGCYHHPLLPPASPLLSTPLTPLPCPSYALSSLGLCPGRQALLPLSRVLWPLLYQVRMRGPCEDATGSSTHWTRLPDAKALILTHEHCPLYTSSSAIARSFSSRTPKTPRHNVSALAAVRLPKREW